MGYMNSVAITMMKLRNPLAKLTTSTLKVEAFLIDPDNNEEKSISIIET